ncbi:MAG: glycosyl hydrolase 53 family protein [Deltaproteobacteria bacterium]|nr:glycosyl hydrolase 53 family protein [Deltaproteobacteria bacterium]MBN2672053.1 glycosyl hydrolase 53 family protein [Deltaproteobacteria bacterium]
MSSRQQTRITILFFVTLFCISGCSRKNVTVLESRSTETGVVDTATADTETDYIDTSTSDTSTEDTSSDTGAIDRVSNLPYILGVDVSLIQQDETAGATYWDEGVQKDLFEIFVDHGFNFAKVWVLVDPSAPGGYAETFDEAFGDLSHVLAMATRIKAAGMGLMISFHCSDKGGDAETQVKPAGWEGHDLPTLEQDMYAHTYNSVEALLNNGTRPDIVQVGNEIALGIVLPEGSIDTPENFGALLSAAVQGIRDADFTIPVALHHPRGRDNGQMVSWLEVIMSQDVDFDIIGASTWAEAESGQYLANFSDLSSRYPTYPFLSLLHSYDDIEVVHDVMLQLPDNRGMGAFLYGPTRSTGTGNAVFDVSDAVYDASSGGFGGTFTTNSFIDLYPPIAERAGL